jgi:hypothetical protein
MVNRRVVDFVSERMYDDAPVLFDDAVLLDVIDLVFDDAVLVNIRAHAAKMVFIAVGAGFVLSDNVVDAICGHPSAMIRLGAVIGLAEAGQRDMLKRFLTDANEAVRLEAQEGIGNEA